MRSGVNTYDKGTYFASRLPPDPDRDRLWKVLCEYLQREVPPNASVLELGGGYCGFINNIRAKTKHVIDLFEDLPSYAAADVIPHVQSCTSLAPIPTGSMDVVFASNLFEHLTREELLTTLLETRRVLRTGGKLLIIQPNFKYCVNVYFDDYTHVQIFTETSLSDLLTSNGFRPARVVPRFLPFSLKSRAPKWSWLLRLYLELPWRPFAGQMYIVASKSDS